MPLEYISHKENVEPIQALLGYIDDRGIDMISAIYSLGLNLLRKEGLAEAEHTAAALSEYADVEVIDSLLDADLPNNEFDLLGLIYQIGLREGAKNIIGSYYTPPKVARNMVGRFELSEGKTFFDPCCGSGAFLLCVEAKDPRQIYGVDNDKIAVLIAKINLLIKYKKHVFTPRVYSLDYLAGGSLFQLHPIFEEKFDYIATNPPWGAMDGGGTKGTIASKETFSVFFVQAFRQLKEGGTIRFLFPESILNVKTHKDIRQFIVDTAGLVGITVYDGTFSGVTTKYVDIECGSGADRKMFSVNSSGTRRNVDIRTVYETENLIFNLLSDDDVSIIRRVKEKGVLTLRGSVWALGIVTGDNKRKLSSVCHEGMEKIYTGKEIAPYVLKPARYYLSYDRNAFQQIAKDEIYRAPEKLVYKFISTKPVFAYDSTGSLFLNSANILIPKIPSMNTKSVMAFLNSSLFRFMYRKMFGETKILRGNLSELPFPVITEEEDQNLTALVDEVLGGDLAKIDVIDHFIYAFYGLTSRQIAHIEGMSYGKAD
ncbi:MAG: N-6 DNA methylase [Thermoguttaceae bacterium]|nr:N-6 DNA methylase [Thermoguttaceae bacterium]